MQRYSLNSAPNKFIYTCSAPPPSPTPLLQCRTRVHAISPELQHCIGGWGEEATHFKTDNSAFLKLKVLCKKMALFCNCNLAGHSVNTLNLFMNTKRDMLLYLFSITPVRMNKLKSFFRLQFTIKRKKVHAFPLLISKCLLFF